MSGKAPKASPVPNELVAKAAHSWLKSLLSRLDCTGASFPQPIVDHFHRIGRLTAMQTTIR